jgi:hypothetical protein
MRLILTDGSVRRGLRPEALHAAASGRSEARARDPDDRHRGADAEGRVSGLSVLAWHFAPADMRCAHDGRRIRAGATLTVPGPVVLCRHGLHGSVRILDALGYAPTETRLCRVRIGGEVVRRTDKLAGTRRTVVWSLTQRQTDRALREFACRCAEGALLEERAAGREPDPRSWAAIEVARRHSAGRATDEELAAASDAARDAASDAAWAAASDAAGAAARDAASDAAWAAARDAAGAAARDAASDAAWAAARDAQNRLLGRLATAAHRRAL